MKNANKRRSGFRWISRLVGLVILITGASASAGMLEFRWEGTITEQTGNPLGLMIGDQIVVSFQLDAEDTTPNVDNPDENPNCIETDCGVGLVNNESFEIALGTATLTTEGKNFIEIGFYADLDPTTVDPVTRLDGQWFWAAQNGDPADFQLDDEGGTNCGFDPDSFFGFFPCEFSGGDGTGNTFAGEFSPFSLVFVPDTPNGVPEPATGALLALGLVSLALRRRR